MPRSWVLGGSGLCAGPLFRLGQGSFEEIHSEDAVHVPGLFLRGRAALVVLPRVRGGIYGEFDPGSGRTLAACLTHASRTMMPFGVD